MAKRKHDQIVIRYMGNTPATDVPGLGVFRHGQDVGFDPEKDPERAAAAIELAAGNINFERVEQEKEGAEA